MRKFHELLEFLHKSNIPNYFMTKNNMIDHLSEDQRLTLIWLINDIRSNPVSHLLSPSSEKCPDPYDLFRPVIDVLDCENEHIRIEACVHAVQNAANYSFEMSETWGEAKKYMSEQSLFLEKLGIKIFPPTSNVARIGVPCDATATGGQQSQRHCYFQSCSLRGYGSTRKFPHTLI